ncbi:hypothetical protein AB3N62_10780 [Leptospira sp. WS4.C2]
MEGLTIELQRDILDSKNNLSNLLRKAILISKKLSVSTIEDWLQNEINGYKSIDSIPDYRIAKGQVKVFNPYRGWLPCNFADEESSKNLTQQAIFMSIGEMEALLKENESGVLVMNFNQTITNDLMSQMSVPLQPALHVYSVEIIKILEIVRNNLLTFSLELEKMGILGEGMTFTKEEKESAKHINYNVTNNIQNMQNSQLLQSNSGTNNFINNIEKINDFIKNIEESLKDLNLKNEIKSEIISEIETLKIQSKSPKPKSQIMRESLLTIRSILEGITGSLIASGLLFQIDKII